MGPLLARAGKRRLPSQPASASGQERRLGVTSGTGLAAVVGLLGVNVGGPHGLGSFLLVAAATAVGLDAVVAIHATRRPVITGRASRSDLVAGDRYALEVRVRRSSFPVELQLAGGEPPTTRADPPADGTLQASARARGVVHTVRLAARSTGLCGLMACTRIHDVRLLRELEVGPRPVSPASPFPELGQGWGEGAAAAAHDAELVRGLRDYLPGDRLRQVHWRATAHTGELVVKETEQPQAPALHLVVDLGAGGDAAEAAAGRAAWYAGEALRRGYHVTLTTMEDGHPLTDAAASLVQVNRRLARAGPGSPPRPKGLGLGVRVLLVSEEGDSWP
ncbi:MAG TPA: DUF58 domain-containing protein [Acidimicrobiales bacterium]|nr:DUF58 domain-containing protein [Acidimicrobiales bacterium]